MATTTNYGWTTPDDTALVKDGAAAIRTLGSSADTTVKNLSPGTTAGDIDYYTAATTKARVGIGTSGQALTVVAGVPSWAASARSTLTTTGDSLYASAANTLARLGIGSTGQVLTVAAGLPSWATPASGGYTLLSTTTLTGTTTTVSSISGSYTDLMVIVNNPYVNVAANLRINPNATASISQNSGTQSSTASASNEIEGHTTNLLPIVSTVVNSYALYIRQYANATFGKPFQFHGGLSSATFCVNRAGHIATATAITSLAFTTAAGTSTFSGGQVLIYGVK